MTNKITIVDMTPAEMRDYLNRLPSMSLDGIPADERVHFIRCEACGQYMDCRRLGDVLHHEDEGHEPIPAQ